MAGGEHIYATLLLSDSYLPGALVLAHSLRDARTSKKLAVLVTLDTVSADAIAQLNAVYDYILPVPRIRNERPSNLYLMNRADLHSAFTKINLWKLVQFERIVYIDADVLAYRAPDELFDLQSTFAAAPDIGWPDIFNTGVLALKPNMGDYYALMAMAERGISFDGADQGLLNMHFKDDWHRLSFTYNVTPSAHYQYIPAYRHFQSSISMVHFIGRNKPWFAGREAEVGGGPYDEMVGRWWAVYDRHYRFKENTPGHTSHSNPSLVQYLTKGECQPQQPGQQSAPVSQAQQQPLSQSEDDQAGSTGSIDLAQQVPPYEQPHGSQSPAEPAQPELAHLPPQSLESPKGEPPPIAMSSWDAQRHAPPTDSKPEAINFPSTQYTMSSDPAPFVPPARYPSPPKNMYYEVPKEKPASPAQPPKPVFPWEGNQPRPSRTFAGERSDPTPIATGSSAEQGPSNNSAPATPSTPLIRISQPAAESWGNFQLSNAWDEIPQINRYVEGLQKHRRVKSIPTAGNISSPLNISSPQPASPRKSRGLKLTDFPSETERPSLPVTPAPIARPSFWGTDEGPSSTNKKSSSTIATHGEDSASQSRQGLPAAEGVPAQAEWDPEAQLQKLARQQYEHVLRKLSADEGQGEKMIPKRSLPFGSEDAMSPTYVKNLAEMEAARREVGVGPPSTRVAAQGASATESEQQGSGGNGLLESALSRE